LLAASLIGLTVFVAGQFSLFVAKTPRYEWRFTHSRLVVIRYNQTPAAVGYVNRPGWRISSFADNPFYVEFIPRLADVPFGTGAIIGKAILLPMTIPLVLLLSATAWSMIAGKTRGRGIDCANCGYSLTGNTSGVCPECGTAVKLDERQGTSSCLVVSSKCREDTPKVD
jgi:hypothetical protein